MNNILIKLLEEHDESKIFNLIVNSSKDPRFFWEDILNTFQTFLPHKSITKKYFIGKDLNILERFGFDIDFEDFYGNTLLFHLFMHNQQNNFLSFDIQDILKKTKKIYHINKMNENILFGMARHLHNVSWKDSQEFISGKNLVDFIENHPDFNLQQFNILNRNLINCCLFNSSFPLALYTYLKEKNVSTSHIDRDNYNLLNFFPLITFNTQVAAKFIELCETNDITNVNRFNDSCLSNWIKFISSKDTNNNNEESHIKWLKFIFENIMNENIIVDNKIKLIDILNTSYEAYSLETQKIIPLQISTISFLKFKILDEKLPLKNIIIKKTKI